MASEITSISPDAIERWSKWPLAEADRIHAGVSEYWITGRSLSSGQPKAGPGGG